MYIQDPAQFLSAKVENIVSYGAFFALEDNCSGFVHISQVQVARVSETCVYASLLPAEEVPVVVCLTVFS